jgi:hypothetical protein
MATYTINDIRGLYTNPNQLSGVPRGGLSGATNCSFNNKGALEPRYGHSKLLSTGQYEDVFFYSGYTFLRHNDTLYYYDDPNVNTITSSKTSNFGTTGLRPVEAMENLYVKGGVLESISGTYKDLGVPKAIGFWGVGSSDYTGSTFLKAGYSCAYRHVWCRLDAHGRLLMGSPSNREVFTNPDPGGALAVDVGVNIPYGITTEHFLRLFRTETTPPGVPPSEEYYLVNEYTGVSSSDISNKYLPIISDGTPDIILTDLAYFSASQGGVLEANDPPPTAEDAVWFGDRMLYANTRQKQTLALSLIGVDVTNAGTGAFTLGDVLTINGRTYTAGSSEDLSTRTFKLYGFTPETALANSAKSLCDIINADGSANVHAYYVPSDTSAYGSIVLEHKLVQAVGTTFSVTCSAHGDSWLPFLPTAAQVAGGTKPAVTSSEDRCVNRIYYSKLRQPEAVPAGTHFVDIGSKNKQIIRIIKCREKVLVFKEDGTFVLSGQAPYRVSELDTTLVLTAENTAVSVLNRVYAATNQGLVAIGDNGTAIIDKNIDIPIYVGSGAFGVADDNSGRYIVASGIFAYVYHIYYDAWTSWTLPAFYSQGRSAPAGRTAGGGPVYFVPPVGIYFEDVLSFYDGVSTITVTAGTMSNMTVSSVAGLSVGDVVDTDGAGSCGVITAINTGTKTLTLAGSSVAAYESYPQTLNVYKSYLQTVTFAPLDFGTPSDMKHFAAITYHFNGVHAYSLTTTFETEAASQKTSTITFNTRSDQLAQDLGSKTGWAIRQTVPLECQRGVRLKPGFTVREAGVWWTLEGISLEVPSASERNSR